MHDSQCGVRQRPCGLIFAAVGVFSPGLGWTRQGEFEAPADGPDAARSQLARACSGPSAVFFLIVALLAYLVVPFNTFMRTRIREQAPTRARTIPSHRSTRA